MKLHSAFPSCDRWLPHGLLFASWLAAAGLSAEPLSGGRFSLVGGPVTGGGGRSDGGSFAVAGGTGETSPALLTGGTYQVTGGLIGVAVVPGEVTLNLIVEGGLVTLMWPAETAGFVLETTPAVGEFADWQPVTPAPVGNTHAAPVDQPFRFFRLRKP